VLIVDDNWSFTELLSSALSAVEGIECVGTAASAAEGLERTAQLSPSVVVMDIMMPGEDGLAATRELRQASPGTAVAVVSAHCDGEWIERAASAGASAYVPKGGSLDEIVKTLKAVRPGEMILAPSLVDAASGASSGSREAAPAAPGAGGLGADSPADPPARRGWRTRLSRR